jgi:hypothetical protein
MTLEQPYTHNGKGGSMERKDIIHGIIQAVGEFNSRRLWKRFTNFDCFGIRVPGQSKPMLGIVLGAGGDEYGLSLFRGTDAAASLAGILSPEGPGDDVVDDTDVLGFSMSAFGELPPDAQSLLREAGRHPRYDEQTPMFMVKPPGQQPRTPDVPELALLLLVLRGVLEADKRRLLQPATLDNEEGICVLTLSGDPAAPQVSVARERWQLPEAPTAVPVQLENIDLTGLPRLKGTWLVGTPTMGPGIKDDSRVMQLLLVADDASQYVLEARPVFAGDLEEAVNALVETLHGHGLGGGRGLPREIIFSNRKLHDAMAMILEPAGVKCTFASVIPKLRELADEFLEHLASEVPPFAGEIDVSDDQVFEVPAPDDLAGWKEADRRLARRFAEHFEAEDRLWTARPIKRYFNDEDLEYYLTEHGHDSVIVAYTAWGILDYRPNKTSKTQAEKMLVEGLPQPEAILLRARMEAYPTLYRVAGHNPKAGTIELEDVLLGGEVTVYDQLMSENIENNLFFPARAFPAGRFHFVEPMGPPLSAGMGLEAVEFLQASKMEFTAEGLRRDAHKFGWLWQWSEQWQANWKPPRLCNMDGDELLWHTASFSVTDPADVRQTLLQRADIQYDDEEDEFVWIAETGPGAEKLGGPVAMGRIEFVGDELVLTVNSAKRFAAARKWLEMLPGVAFRNLETRRWDEREEDRPMDERMAEHEPVEIVPELEVTLQEMVNKQYVKWIDTPLPILGGKTPRQACKTEAGRRQVTMLIRTTPDPMDDASVRVPRETMLRELGLAAEPPTSPLGGPQPQPAAASEPALPDRKVGRNDPCPCGSGRKYKKCCGR